MNQEIINKPIKNLSINIGQSAIGGFPAGDVFITFMINERYSILPLKDLKKWIDTIYDSKGDRNEKAYKAYDNLKAFFHELLSPYIDYNLPD